MNHASTRYESVAACHGVMPRQGVHFLVLGLSFLYEHKYLGLIMQPYPFGNKTPRNIVFARRGFFVNRHYFQSSKNKNDADTQNVPFKHPEQQRKNLDEEGAPLAWHHSMY